MDDIGTFLEVYGLAAIFGIMLVKAIGVPIPIPADALMIATSAQAAAGRFVVWQAFVALLIALVIGGLIQFALVRGPGRNALYRYGRYLGMTPSRLDVAADKLKKGGTLGIGVAILTPGVRSVVIPAAGLACLPFRQFTPGLTLGSSTFLALHFFLGYVGGALLGWLGTIIPLPILGAAVLIILAAGFLIWYILRRRQMWYASPKEVMCQAYHSWHDATCPICLALGAADRLQAHCHVPPARENAHAGAHV